MSNTIGVLSSSRSLQPQVATAESAAPVSANTLRAEDALTALSTSGLANEHTANPAEFLALVAATPVSDPIGQLSANFSHFKPSRAVMYRDGGTIELTGDLNRGQSAGIRIDGGMASPTRGEVFVTLKPFNRPDEEERPMMKQELEELAMALARSLESPMQGVDVRVVEQALQKVQLALLER
jgi:hypothetical protein